MGQEPASEGRKQVFGETRQEHAMRHGKRLALATLLAGIGLAFGAAPQTRAPKSLGDETLQQRLARTTKLSEDDVNKLWSQLGAAIKEDLLRGQQVIIPGLGMMRIVRVPEHKDLKDGRPVTIAATNTVEFLASKELTAAANSKGVEPSETVPEYRFKVFPNQTSTERAPSTRVPTQRIGP